MLSCQALQDLRHLPIKSNIDIVKSCGNTEFVTCTIIRVYHAENGKYPAPRGRIGEVRSMETRLVKKQLVSGQNWKLSLHHWTPPKHHLD